MTPPSRESQGVASANVWIFLCLHRANWMSPSSPGMNRRLIVHIQVFEGSSKIQRWTYFQNIYFKRLPQPRIVDRFEFLRQPLVAVHLFFRFEPSRGMVSRSGMKRNNAHISSSNVQLLLTRLSSALALPSHHSGRTVFVPSRRLSARVRPDSGST